MTDLFGNEYREDVKPSGRPHRSTKGRKNGYAWTPGTGPEGETCGSCLHRAKRGKFSKCKLVREKWTNSYGTDVLVKSPACRKWEAK